jgi:hypothetical protein
MKARQLIDGAALGPDALKVIGQAFDQAWAQIAANYGNDPKDVERGRLRLARAVLEAATDDSRDVKQLTRSALEAMALGYKKKSSPPP